MEVTHNIPKVIKFFAYRQLFEVAIFAVVELEDVTVASVWKPPR